MNNKNKSFDNRIHFVGKITVFACLTCFIMLPIVLSWIYKTPIDYKLTLTNALPILASFTVAAICENVSYTPIIGPGALYTSCITGDLSNMKVPAAVNAMELANVEPGSKKGNIISIIAVCICTFVTTSIAFLGMLFLAPIIDPIFKNPYINPAFDNLIPAIFGALLIPKLIENPKQNIPIFIIPPVLYVILQGANYSKYQGYILIILVVLAILYSYILNKNEISISSNNNENKKE